MADFEQTFEQRKNQVAALREEGAPVVAALREAVENAVEPYAAGINGLAFDFTISGSSTLTGDGEVDVRIRRKLPPHLKGNTEAADLLEKINPKDRERGRR